MRKSALSKILLAGIFAVFIISSQTALADDPNLVSWWKFDEGSGRTAYDSAGGNNGVITGAAWFNDTCRGMCLSFDGSGDYVLVGDKDNLEQQAFTLSFWAILNNPSASVQGGIAKGYIFGSPIEYSYKIDFDSGYVWPALTNTSDVAFGLRVPLADTYWHMWSMTVGGGTLTLYKDGAFVNSTGYTGTVDYTKNNNNFVIGARSNGSYAFNGKIDDVCFYNSALSAVEIWHLYREGLWPKASNPNPADGATGIILNTVLSWSPGKDAASHDVYFGTNLNDVNNANALSPEYKGNFGVNSFDPCGLDFSITYYWRIDEVNEPNVWKGSIWSFTTARPAIGLSATQFQFTAIEGGENPNCQILGISNIGAGTLHWRLIENCGWLSAEPNNGSSTGEVDDVNLIVDTSGLPVGIYTCNLTVSDPNASNNPQMASITLHVRDSDDTLHVPLEYSTIQAAIDAAVNGDTVVVAPGTYTGDGNRDIDFLGKAITIRSTNPKVPCVVAATIIDCNGTNAEPHRGFYLHTGEGVNSVVGGLTIIDGYANDGAGIYCDGSSPTITKCVFMNGNAPNWGGGICCYNASPVISDCTFTENSAREGGAVTTRMSGTASIKNCRMSNNYGSLDGGAFNSDVLTTPTIFNCIITGNHSGSLGGGGIAIWQSNPIIKNCVIAGNYTEGWGSGILQDYYFADGSQIINCVITQNIGKDNGDDSTGILCESKMLVKNSIIGGNTDTIPGDLLWTDCDVTFAYCDVLNSGGSGPDWHVYLVQDGGHNIDVPPEFTEPGYWDPNGTPGIISDDFWVDGDYHLKSQAGRWNPNSESWVTDANTSPCIDAGDPNSDWTAELWPHGKRINMGAYGGTSQASMSLSRIGNIANIDNDPCDTVDFNDLVLFVGKWLHEEVLLPEDLDRNGIVNFVDYAIFAREWFEP